MDRSSLINIGILGIGGAVRARPVMRDSGTGSR